MAKRHEIYTTRAFRNGPLSETLPRPPYTDESITSVTSILTAKMILRTGTDEENDSSDFVELTKSKING